MNMKKWLAMLAIVAFFAPATQALPDDPPSETVWVMTYTGGGG